jgi:hypothetical protein
VRLNELVLDAPPLGHVFLNLLLIAQVEGDRAVYLFQA